MKKWWVVLGMWVALLAMLAGCGPTDAVAAGAGTLELWLKLPDGYHLNSGTVSRVTWEVDGAVVDVQTDLDYTVDTLADPLRLPVKFAVGETQAIAHLNLRYCSDDETQCFVENQDLQMPVRVAAASSRSILAAEYTIVPPTG